MDLVLIVDIPYNEAPSCANHLLLKSQPVSAADAILDQMCSLSAITLDLQITFELIYLHTS